MIRTAPLVSLLCLLALASVYPATLASEFSQVEPSPTAISFFVGDSALDVGMLEGVQIQLITDTGELRPLGVTGSDGEVAIEKKWLLGGLYVVFSLEGYFDGAWRVDEPFLSRAGELYIKLARFSVR